MNETLPMSRDEIVRDYMAAKTPLRQIKVLAELNCTDKPTIVQILREAGCPLPKNYDSPGKRPPKPKEEPAAKAAEPEASCLTVGALQKVLAEFPGDTPILAGGMKLRQMIYTMTCSADGSRLDALELR